MPRVCHISTVHPVTDVRIFHRECCSLVNIGYEVHLVIPTEQTTTLDGVCVHAIRRVKNRLLRMLVMPWVAMVVALRTKAAIYHFHDPELIPVGFVLRWILFRRVVYDVHEAVEKQILSKEWLPAWTRPTISKLYKVAEWLLTPGLTIVLANEGSVRDYKPSAYLVRNYPLLRQRDLEATHRWEDRDDAPLLLYLGRVSHTRGGMLYVRLAHLLSQRGTDFRMMIVGPYESRYGQELQSHIEKWNLTDRVTLTGHMDYDRALDHVLEAAIGLCLLLPVPNYTSCLATKILEYMMFGTPVLASRFDCWRDYVEGERAGRMVDPLDMDEIVSVCQDMLDHRPALRTMGERGVAAVHERYNWSTELETLRKCYRDLLGGSGL